MRAPVQYITEHEAASFYGEEVGSWLVPKGGRWVRPLRVDQETCELCFLAPVRMVEGEGGEAKLGENEWSLSITREEAIRLLTWEEIATARSPYMYLPKSAGMRGLSILCKEEDNAFGGWYFMFTDQLELDEDGWWTLPEEHQTFQLLINNAYYPPDAEDCIQLTDLE